MTDSLFHLNWYRDLKGYRVEPREVSQVRRSRLLAGDQNYIVREGGSLESYKPFDIVAIYRRLAEVKKTPQAAIKFCCDFGFLIGPKARKMSLAEFFSYRDSMRRLVPLYDHGLWYRIEAELLTAAGQGDGRSPFGGAGRLGVLFTFGEGTRPSLKFRPSSLYGAMLCQLLDDAAGGTPYRRCALPSCGQYFKYGPDTDHRNTARYCCAKHQQAHAYLSRKEKGK